MARGYMLGLCAIFCSCQTVGSIVGVAAGTKKSGLMSKFSWMESYAGVPGRVEYSPSSSEIPQSKEGVVVLASTMFGTVWRNDEYLYYSNVRNDRLHNVTNLVVFDVGPVIQQGRTIERAELILYRKTSAGVQRTFRLGIVDINACDIESDGGSRRTTDAGEMAAAYKRAQEKFAEGDKGTTPTVLGWNGSIEERDRTNFGETVDNKNSGSRDSFDATSILRKSVERKDRTLSLMIGTASDMDSASVISGNPMQMGWHTSGQFGPRLFVVCGGPPPGQTGGAPEEKPSKPSQSLEQRLEELKRMRERGLISEQEYQRLRQQAIDGK